jgi:hypothetical protein
VLGRTRRVDRAVDACSDNRWSPRRRARARMVIVGAALWPVGKTELLAM